MHNQSDTSGNPTLQILDVKAIGGGGGGPNERFRLVISDGQCYMQGMLATQLNHLATEQQVCHP
jgi:replication factor A1